jgi:NAD+ synthase
MENPTDHTHNLTLNTGLARNILVNFIRDGIQSAGFRKGILGLSGGVDSALSAHLAAEALGPENLLCVIMPYRSSNPGSRTDAELVAAGLGVRTEVVDISPMVDAHVKRVEADANLRLGNIMARERMVVLYDISARDRGLVIGTGNKTETLLGYGTLFGDMACALNPLGDLYKTQVWQLAESIGVPKAIIDKQPSADLWEGQQDEHELGFTYAEADRLLYCMVDERRSNEELVSMGFEERLIKEIQERVRKNQFKRRPPLIAKISNRTTNIDFRYPREWGV